MDEFTNEFINAFKKCFNENLEQKACGREYTKKLIAAAQAVFPGTDYGNCSTGFMNVKNIVNLYNRIHKQ